MLRWILALVCVAVFMLSSNILAAEAKEEGAVTATEPELATKEAAPEEDTGEGVITGTVTAINKEASTLVLKDKEGNEKIFSVVEGETILWKGVEDITLGDISTGGEAEVGYYTDDKGILVASWVDLIIPEETPATQETPAAPSTEATTEQTETDTGVDVEGDIE